jgi:WD40 repeat protein
MKIYTFLGLFLILLSCAKSHGCGVSYDLPSGQLASSVAFSPNSSYLVAASPGGNPYITLFNAVGGILSAGTSYEVTNCAVTFSPDGAYVAAAGCTTVVIFSVGEGILTQGGEYYVPNGTDVPCTSVNISSVAFSPNGLYLATANSGSNNVTLFSVSAGVLSNGKSYALPTGSTSPQSIAFSPDGSYLATANCESNDVTIFALTEGALSGATSYALPGGSTGPVSVAFSPNGSYLATANQSNDVTLFKVAGRILNNGASYPLPQGSVCPISVAFSPDGSYVTTANSSSNDITVFNVTEGALSAGISYPLSDGSLEPHSIAFSPNGSYIATANQGGVPKRSHLAIPDSTGDISLFKFADGKLNNGTSYDLPEGSSIACSITFSPNGLYLVTGNGGSDDVTLFANCTGSIVK